MEARKKLKWLLDDMGLSPRKIDTMLSENPELRMRHHLGNVGKGRTASYIGLRAEMPKKFIRAVGELLEVPPDWFTDEKEPESQTYVEKFANFDGSLLEPVVLSSMRGVLAGSEEEFFQFADDEELSIPRFLVPSGDCFVIVVSGMSMSPRLQTDDKAVIKRCDRPPVGTLCVAKDPENRVYVKGLSIGIHPSPYKLCPVNSSFDDITDVEGWQFVGSVTAILKRHTIGPNVEVDWDDPAKPLPFMR